MADLNQLHDSAFTQGDEVIRALFEPDMKAQEAVRAETGHQAEQLRLAALNLLGSTDGLRFVCAVLDQTGTFASSFTGNSATFFLEGKRYVGLYIYQLLMTADPLAMQKLITFRREHLQGDHHG